MRWKLGATPPRMGGGSAEVVHPQVHSKTANPFGYAWKRSERNLFFMISRRQNPLAMLEEE
jgi:hypothetical protein